MSTMTILGVLTLTAVGSATAGRLLTHVYLLFRPHQIIPVIGPFTLFEWMVMGAGIGVAMLAMGV